MALSSLQDLLVAELKDLYSAEKQLTKALPKMAKAASTPELQQAFKTHLEETKVHIERLQQICEGLGVKPTGKTCHGMKGLVEEGEEMISEKGEPEVKDAGLISAAQRVEHHEMAGYGCVRTYARQLGLRDAEKLLDQTLKEEEATDQLLTQLAEGWINQQAKSPRK